MSNEKIHLFAESIQPLQICKDASTNCYLAMSARFSELIDEYMELRAIRDNCARELEGKYPNGFTGNSSYRDYEFVADKYMHASDRLQEWMDSEVGAEFKRLRPLVSVTVIS